MWYGMGLQVPDPPFSRLSTSSASCSSMPGSRWVGKALVQPPRPARLGLQQVSWGCVCAARRTLSASPHRSAVSSARSPSLLGCMSCTAVSAGPMAGQALRGAAARLRCPGPTRRCAHAGPAPLACGPARCLSIHCALTWSRPVVWSLNRDTDGSDPTHRSLPAGLQPGGAPLALRLCA